MRDFQDEHVTTMADSVSRRMSVAEEWPLFTVAGQHQWVRYGCFARVAGRAQCQSSSLSPRQRLIPISVELGGRRIGVVGSGRVRQWNIGACHYVELRLSHAV